MPFLRAGVVMANFLFFVIRFGICTAVAGPVFGILALIAWGIAAIFVANKDAAGKADKVRKLVGSDIRQ